MPMLKLVETVFIVLIQRYRNFRDIGISNSAKLNILHKSFAILLSGWSASKLLVYTDVAWTGGSWRKPLTTGIDLPANAQFATEKILWDENAFDKKIF